MWQEILPGGMFTIWNIFWQDLGFAVRQEEIFAVRQDDATERTLGRDHAVEEIAFLLMELHGGCHLGVCRPTKFSLVRIWEDPN